MITVADLDPTDASVARYRALLTTFVRERYPGLAVAGGPLADLLLGPGGTVLAAVGAAADAAEATVDLEAALATGTADPAVLDALLAARGVTRRPGAKATGAAVLTVAALATVTVGPGSTFETADGLVFVPAQTYTLYPPGSDVFLAGDVAGTEIADGNYEATVEVQAQADGAAGNKPGGTTLTADPAVANLLAGRVASGLTGGADEESDAELLARLDDAQAPAVAGSRAGVENLVAAEVGADAVTAVVGFGHPGLRRGASGVALQPAGRCDARVRTPLLGRTYARVEAELQSVVGPVGTWRFALTKDDVPGWVIVPRVVQTGATTDAGYAVTELTRGYDVAGVSNPPDVRSATDAAGSAYAIMSGEFADTDTDASGLTPGDTREYDVEVRLVVGIGAAQASVMLPEHASPGADCLVRAATPVLVTLSLTVRVPAGATVDTGLVAATAATAVGTASGLSGRLYASAVLAAVTPTLPAGGSVTAAAMSGAIYEPDGSVGNVTGTDLIPTTDYANGVGPDVTAFYADPEDVAVSVIYF